METFVMTKMPYEKLQEKVLDNEHELKLLETKVLDENDDPKIVVPDKSQYNRGSAGMVYMYNESSGLRLDGDKRLCISAADKSDIILGTSVNKPITPYLLDYALSSKSFKGDISEVSSSEEADAIRQKPASVGAVNDFVGNVSTDILNKTLPNLLNFKMTAIEKGGRFEIKPGMLALVLPYGDYTLSSHKADGTQIAASMGTTMVFASERDDAYDGDYWAAFLYAKNAVVTVTVSSNHNRYSTDCYIQNNYSGSEGSGRAYVYYISRPKP